MAVWSTASQGASSSGRRAASAPRTLALTRSPIRAFAQDGGRIAWASRCTVRVRTVAGKNAVVVGGGRLGSSCFEDGSWLLALGGSRAVWGGYYRTSSNNRYGAVLTGAPGTRQRKLEDLEQVERQWGAYLTDIAADGETRVYANVYIRQLRGPECPPCFYRVTGFPVRRVGVSRSSVAGTGPVVALAASAGRIAVVPADIAESETRMEPRAVANGPVELRNAASGALLASFSPRGRVTGIALSGTVAAVLVRDEIEPRIERYSAVTGTRIDSYPIFLLAANEVSVSGSRLVFRIGRAIYVFDTVTREQVRVTAAASPIGLSLEGNRLAWAENVLVRGKLRGRIRAVLL